MTIREIRTLRNMLLIGGTVTSISFLSGLGSAKGNYYFDYPTDKAIKVAKTIDNVDSIEDLEFAKKCKFLFYKKGQSSSNVQIKDARNFINIDQEGKKENEKKVFSEVNAHREKCQEDSFVYVAI